MWEDDREAVEARMNTYLDGLEEINDAWAASPGESWEELNQMKEEIEEYQTGESGRSVQESVKSCGRSRLYTFFFHRKEVSGFPVKVFRFHRPVPGIRLEISSRNRGACGYNCLESPFI